MSDKVFISEGLHPERHQRIIRNLQHKAAWIVNCEVCHEPFLVTDERLACPVTSETIHELITCPLCLYKAKAKADGWELP